jgi:hypothetical protein
MGTKNHWKRRRRFRRHQDLMERLRQEPVAVSVFIHGAILIDPSGIRELEGGIYAKTEERK